MGWIEITSVAVAVVSAVLSFWFSVKSSHSQADANTSSRRTALNEYRRDIREWAFRCIDCLARLEAVHMAPKDTGNGEIAELVTEISGHIDQGRLFFPNTGADHTGGPGTINRGWRDRKLDPLVAAHRMAVPRPGDPVFADVGLAIREARKDFVFLFQIHLDPANPDQNIEKISECVPGERMTEVLRKYAAELER